MRASRESHTMRIPMTRSFTDRHPYRFVVLLESVVILVPLLAGTIAHFVSLSTLGLYALAYLSLTVIVAVLLTTMGWWRAVGFRRPDRRSDLWYFVVPFVPAAINLIPGSTSAAWVSCSPCWRSRSWWGSWRKASSVD